MNIKMTERDIRIHLAAAYRILADQRMDDLTYTHLSARLPNADAYFISPFGLLFEEVTASNLLKLSLDGQVLEGTESQYNQTGYVIHGSIYKHRPDLNAVFHLHTFAGIAVSTMVEGLLPLSQFALHFYDKVGYHNYDSLALEDDRQGNDLVKDLSSHKALFLRHHGTLTCGSTIHEAYLYMHFLEQACRVQCTAVAQKYPLLHLSTATCKKASQDLRDFEENFGIRDWTALLRKLDRIGSTYKD